MDDNTRENLREAIRDNMAGMVADCHAGIGYRVIEDRVDNIMDAIDEATAPRWTPVTPEAMPPENVPVLVSWGEPDDALIARLSRASGFPRWFGAGREVWGPAYWTLLPDPPTEA